MRLSGRVAYDVQPDVRMVYGVRGRVLPERGAVCLVRRELREVQRGVVRQVQERDVPERGEMCRLHEALELRRVRPGRATVHAVHERQVRARRGRLHIVQRRGLRRVS